MTKFISNLKKYRQFNELTQEELAVRISKALDTPIEELFIFEL